MIFFLHAYACAVHNHGFATVSYAPNSLCLPFAQEAMRCLPAVAAGTMRHNAQPLRLGGHVIPADVALFVPFMANFSDPTLWDRADEFLPVRSRAAAFQPRCYPDLTALDLCRTASPQAPSSAFTWCSLLLLHKSTHSRTGALLRT